ncbi:MAG: C10 family peptidase [Prevotella sp.]|nr:C10 family peptidase [Prevotella sp.]
MFSAAAEALRTTDAMHAPSSESRELVELKSNAALTLIGYDGGAFAVVAADDMFPAILGVSSTRYSNGRNPNFEFWLRSMSAALTYRAEHNIPSRIIAPDPNVYPTDVPPMLTTEWDQLTPYNNLLPSGIYTGCVATAMAQVLNYHKLPEHGIGTASVYAKGTQVIATFEDDYYDWSNMRDTYMPGEYSDVEADAVALLMRDCGVAAKMQYGDAFDGGSGAYSQDAAKGLRDHFGFDNAQCKERNNFSEEEWMDMVFSELSTRGPLYYGGTDMQHFAGHAFVLHGYNEEGLVYVNWGWSGDDDGYYDISLLNPPGYRFSAQQDMIIGIEGQGTPLVSIDTLVTVERGGQLALQLDSLKERVASLKVVGELNGTDMRLIRWMAGCDVTFERTKGILRQLDLSEARIVSGGEPYFIDHNGRHTTREHTITSLLFYGCRNLRDLVLPVDITAIEKGAFALCTSLRTLDIPNGDDKTYVIKDHTLFPKSDTCCIQEVLPTCRGEYVVPKGITTIDDYAFAGCSGVMRIEIPSTVTSVGDYAFQNTVGLTSIKMALYDIPATGSNALEGVKVRSCKLQVPASTKEQYKRHPVWGLFAGGGGATAYDNIVEYGSAITARNAGRFYGEENPKLGYMISGDIPSGIPEVTCDATIDSPVGDYVIHVEPGTIEEEIVQYFDGVLHVWAAPLNVSVEDYTRMEGEENPVFELKYEGFKLGQDMEVITTLPVATCEADASSAPGTYAINISGGVAPNYEFKYKSGTLTVTPDPTGITEITRSGQGKKVVYTLDGRRMAVKDLKQLPKGIYVLDGKKVTIQ